MAWDDYVVYNFDHSWRFKLGLFLAFPGLLALVVALALSVFDPPPAFSELKRVSGRLEKKVLVYSPHRGPWAQLNLLTLGGRVRTSIQNVGHLRKGETGHLLLEVEPGTPLTVWISPEDKVVWEIRMNDVPLLSYAATRNAESRGPKGLAMFWAGPFILGVFFLFWSWKRQQNMSRIVF